MGGTRQWIKGIERLWTHLRYWGEWNMVFFHIFVFMPMFIWVLLLCKWNSQAHVPDKNLSLKINTGLCWICVFMWICVFPSKGILNKNKAKDTLWNNPLKKLWSRTIIMSFLLFLLSQTKNHCTKQKWLACPPLQMHLIELIKKERDS